MGAECLTGDDYLVLCEDIVARLDRLYDRASANLARMPVGLRGTGNGRRLKERMEMVRDYKHFVESLPNPPPGLDGWHENRRRSWLDDVVCRLVEGFPEPV